MTPSKTPEEKIARDPDHILDLIAKAIRTTRAKGLDKYQWSNRAAQVALSAHAEWLAKEGLAIVPREPTEDMCDAAEPFLMGDMDTTSRQDARNTWRAMIERVAEIRASFAPTPHTEGRD